MPLPPKPDNTDEMADTAALLGPPTPRKRRKRVRRVCTVLVVLLGGVLILLQTPMSKLVVLPVLRAQTGLEVSAGGCRVTPAGTIVLSDALFEAPGIPGRAGKVLSVERATARLSWGSILRGSPGVKNLVLTGPLLRVSQDIDTGVLNIAAMRPLTGSGGGPTPTVEIRRGVVELGEHRASTDTLLRDWSVVGRLDEPGPDGVAPFTLAAVPTGPSAGSPGAEIGSLVFTGSVGPDGLEAVLEGLALDDWPASIVPTRVRPIYERLDLGGEILPTRFTVDPDGRVTASMTLDGVGVTLPFDESYSLEGEGDLLRMRSTRGTIDFGSDGVQASLSGLIDELRYDVDLDYQGLGLDSPFFCELTTSFRIDESFRPRRFLPPDAIEKLEMFDNPTADVGAVVSVSRSGVGGEIEVEGQAVVRNGSGSYRQFRYPFTSIAGRVGFTRNSLTIDGLTGIGPSGAILEASGEFDGLGDDSVVELRIGVTGVGIDEDLLGALSRSRREQAEALFNRERFEQLVADGLVREPGIAGDESIPEFRFGGKADISLVLARHPERPEGDRWTRDATVRLDDAGLVPEHFPWPIVAREVELLIGQERILLSGGRYEGVAGGTAGVRAELDLTTEVLPGRDRLPVVEITAEGIPVDRRLLAAIPGYRSDVDTDGDGVSLKSILDNLRVSGTVECMAIIGPRSDGSLGYDVEASVLEGEARPRAWVAAGDESTEPIDPMSDPLVLGSMFGTVYVTERIIVVDLESELRAPGQPLAPTRLDLLTQLTLPEERGGLGAVSREGGLLPIDHGPPLPGPELFVLARADGLDLAMPLEHAAGVVSPDLAQRLMDLRTQRRPDGTIATRVEIDGIVNGHAETKIDLERITALEFDHDGVRYRVGPSWGSMGLRMGIHPSVVFESFRSPIVADGVPTGEVSLDGMLTLRRPGIGEAIPDQQLVAGVRNGRIESPIVTQLLGSFAPGIREQISRAALSGMYDLDLALSPAQTQARDEIGAGFSIPTLEATGELKPLTLALDLPTERIEFDSIGGVVHFDGLSGRIEGLRAESSGVSVGVSGGWSVEPGAGASLDLGMSVSGEALDGSVRAMLPSGLVSVLDRFEIVSEGPIQTEGLRVRATGLGTDQGRTNLSGTVLVEQAQAQIGLPVRDLAGRVGFNAEISQGNASYAIDIVGDRLRAGPIRVENLRGSLLTDPDDPGVILVPELEASVHGGRFAGSAQARIDDAGTRFWIDLHGSDIRAAPVFDDLLLPEAGLAGPPLPGQESVLSAWSVTDDYTRGLLDADISLTGVAGQPSRSAGRGVVRVAGGSVIALPGLINLIEVSNLRAPVGAELDLAEAVFYVDGTSLAFERLNASSNTVAILGHGTMDWDTREVDLRFRSRASTPIPVLSSIIEAVRDELITTKVTGAPGSISYSTEPFGRTRQVVRSLLGEPPTEQERLMSSVERSSRQSKDRGLGRTNDPVMPVTPGSDGSSEWANAPADN